MDAQELLKEAMKRYPPGTKFSPAHVNDLSVIFTVKDYTRRQNPEGTNVQPYILEHESWSPTVYYEGKWAKIIEPEILNNYEIY